MNPIQDSNNSKVIPMLVLAIITLVAIAFIAWPLFDDDAVSAYAPTAQGSEVQFGGHVPPGLSFHHDEATRVMKFRFGTSDVAPFGTSFDMPLDDQELQHILTIKTTSGPVAQRVAELSDIVMIIVYNDGIDVEYSSDANVNRLQVEIENIIAAYG